MKQPMYSALGGVFEYLNSDCGYEQWSQYLIERLKRLGAGAEGLDIGCGNGYFTRALWRAGYRVKGIDISPRMLSQAVILARAEGVGAEFLEGDITKLKLSGKVGFAVAVNDCINYVPHDKLFACFKRVAACLVKGGAFIFDVSTPYKLENILGDNVFFDDDEKVSYIWSNRFCGDRVEMDITVFIRGEDGRYAREDESQTQYAHSEEDIAAALEKAGFSFETEGHLGGDKLERINFLCKKL